ncbi:MAG: bifunctional phosphopantothenoylcysteine decarboxylase/phosphopantothenate--cysteine ligase CoaBC [Thermoplasmatota archaeon]
MTHPCDDIRGTLSRRLDKKTIVLGVTGSIAAVETVRLARQLIRHGAAVIPVMTPAAREILHPYALEFATGIPPITKLTGAVEHVEHCGARPDNADMVLVAPCTANTLSKIALAIDDTPVTTYATTALGSDVPVMLVPAMHASMYDNRFVMDNLERLREHRVSIVGPRREEGTAKIAGVDDIVAHVLQKLGPHDLDGRRVIVVGGATAEPVDEVRVLSNRSSGKMARALAQAAFIRGAVVELWHSGIEVPGYIPSKRFTSHRDIIELAEHADHADVIINCAAISDFVPDRHEGKLSSGSAIDLHLTPAERVNPYLRDIADTAVAFKLDTSEEQAVERARQRLQQDDFDYAVANTTASLGSDQMKAWVIDRSHTATAVEGDKQAVAERLLDHVA